MNNYQQGGLDAIHRSHAVAGGFGGKSFKSIPEQFSTHETSKIIDWTVL